MHSYTYSVADWGLYQHIDVTPVDGPLGAEVRCGDLRAIGAEAMAEIRQAWLDHLVLVFRGQTLSDADLLALGAKFGTLDDTTRPQPVDQPAQNLETKALTTVSNVVENGKPLGALSNVDLVWHTDMSYIAVPPDASVLFAVEVTSQGGETGFSNMYFALDRLPRELRAKLDGVTIKHDATHNSGGFLRAGFELPRDPSVSPGPSHTAIRTHPETGIDALFLGRRPYAYVHGLPVAESDALLDQLWAHAAKPEFAWYHKWTPGDVVIWDNRCTMHRRNSFPNEQRRIMRRTQIKGTKPFHDDVSPKLLHPRTRTTHAASAPA